MLVIMDQSQPDSIQPTLTFDEIAVLIAGRVEVNRCAPLKTESANRHFMTVREARSSHGAVHLTVATFYVETEVFGEEAVQQASSASGIQPGAQVNRSTRLDQLNGNDNSARRQVISVRNIEVKRWHRAIR